MRKVFISSFEISLTHHNTLINRDMRLEDQSRGHSFLHADSTSIWKAIIPIFISIILLNPFSSAAEEADGKAAQTTTASKLVADEHGILRLHAGTDGKSAIELAEELSLDVDSGYLVITVLTNDKFEQQAIAHGRKLQSWFEKQISTRDYVPLVVHKNDKGVGVIFNMCGYPYYHDEYALIPHGVMTVQNSVKVLDDARITHIASRHIKNEQDMAAAQERLAASKAKEGQH